MKKLSLVLLAISCFLFLGASCYKNSSSSTSSSPVATTPVATDQISISNFAFDPSSTTVAKGTTVTWTNNDSTTHTVTSNDNKFASTKLAPGDKFSFTFSDAGTFGYHCSIHTSMTGQVEVK